MRKICIVTGTRADWGLLSGIAKALDERPDVELQIIATNMHLAKLYGETWHEIERCGLHIDWRVPMNTDNDSALGTVSAMSECMTGMAQAFEALKPDLLLILGDRYEMLATASAALIFRIPIAHIAGGTISEGAYDDSIRHSITKMSHIHLTETEECRNRVIQLGEDPQRVFNVGAVGIYNITHNSYMSHDELQRELSTPIPEKSLLVTFHPATLDSLPPRVQCENLLAALNQFPDYKVFFTYPNNDTDGKVIISLIEDYTAQHPDCAAVYPSLGQMRYFSLLKCVRAAVGNSSSGIVEVPSMGIPTLDIGIRQKGRLAAPSVVHCGVSVDDITSGLNRVLGTEMQTLAKSVVNPYSQPDTLQRIVDTVATYSLAGITVKPFHDLPSEKTMSPKGANNTHP